MDKLALAPNHLDINLKIQLLSGQKITSVLATMSSKVDLTKLLMPMLYHLSWVIILSLDINRMSLRLNKCSCQKHQGLNIKRTD